MKMIRSIGIGGLVIALVISLGMLLGPREGAIPTPEKIEGVKRVLMHEPQRVSLMVKVPDSAELKIRTFEQVGVHFYTDAPADGEMWALLTPSYFSDKDQRQVLEKLDIHIYAAEDVNGAGWNHGKFGKGQTEVVE